MAEDTKYCLCCGENVPFGTFERNERLETTCAYCGFTLDVQNLWEPKKQEPAAAVVTESYALVTDDSTYTRKSSRTFSRQRYSLPISCPSRTGSN